MSPGTKAAILFYLLCKYVNENPIDITIRPVSEVTVDNEYHMIKKTNKIIDYVKNKFPNVIVDEPRYIRKVFDDPLVPQKALAEEALEYQKENSINAIIMAGTTKVLELDYLKKIQSYHGNPLDNFDKIKYMIDNADSLRVPNLGDWPIDYVFSEFTKDQIYEMYETYNIKDLFDLTLSCDKIDLLGCGTCFGCAERSYLENNLS